MIFCYDIFEYVLELLRLIRYIIRESIIHHRLYAVDNEEPEVTVVGLVQLADYLCENVRLVYF